MKFDIGKTATAAILLLTALCEGSKHGLSHLDVLERRHQHHRRLHASVRAEETSPALQPELLKKRGGQCQFPTNVGLVAVTPDEQNEGWAMSPNQPCLPGNYCPYACPPGQLAMQWNPQATSYTYPLSMDGGLYCDENGNIQKPFPDQDYCVDGVGSITAQNTCGETVSFCQTVLPGNEAMLIPTSVDSTQVLAVPGMDYWCSTAAHYYVNAPGVTTEQACIWGDGSEPIGNWSPYVTGANVDENGNTFAKIGWNPIYTGSNFAGTMPTWGIKIECNGEGCNGLPCSIDPSVNSMNEVTSSESASGAGGADFCVATIPKGMTANIVVFNAGDSSGSGSSGPASSSAPEAPAPTTSSPPPPPSTSAPIVSETSTSSIRSTPSSTSTIPKSTIHSSTSTIYSQSIKPTVISSSSFSTSAPIYISVVKNATGSPIDIFPTGGDSAHNLVQSATGFDALANPTSTLDSHLSAATTGAASNGTNKPSGASISFRRSGAFGAAGLTLVALFASWFL